MVSERHDVTDRIVSVDKMLECRGAAQTPKLRQAKSVRIIRVADPSGDPVSLGVSVLAKDALTARVVIDVGNHKMRHRSANADTKLLQKTRLIVRRKRDAAVRRG